MFFIVGMRFSSLVGVNEFMSLIMMTFIFLVTLISLTSSLKAEWFCFLMSLSQHLLVIHGIIGFMLTFHYWRRLWFDPLIAEDSPVAYAIRNRFITLMPDIYIWIQLIDFTWKTDFTSHLNNITRRLGSIEIFPQLMCLRFNGFCLPEFIVKTSIKFFFLLFTWYFMLCKICKNRWRVGNRDPTPSYFVYWGRIVYRK